MSSYKLLKKYISFMFLCFHIVNSSDVQLKNGFYLDSCGLAEDIVKKEVENGFNIDNGVAAAGLIKLHFLDCFVRGCEGSVLLDTTPSNTAEKDATIIKNLHLRAFAIIDNAKASLELACPGVVSCADIVAFAARDSFELTGGIRYDVLSGRRDGNGSSASEALSNLPAPTFNLTQLTQLFAEKGLTQDDMVALSGAHTVGMSHCASFVNRLKSSSQGPPMDPTYAAKLRQLCSNASVEVSMDPTPNHTDTQYFKGVMLKRSLFTSDQTLMTTRQTGVLVKQFANNSSLWKNKFAAAMVKMGNTDVLTGNEGEIRAKCRKING